MLKLMSAAAAAVMMTSAAHAQVFVQVAAPSSIEEAIALSDQLTARYRELLGSAGPYLQPIAGPDGVRRFRVLFGTFPGTESAQGFCRQLQTSCIVR